jgi:hypothetical protein
LSYNTADIRGRARPNTNGTVSIGGAEIMGGVPVADLFHNGGDVAGADRTLGNKDDFSLGILTNNEERIHVHKDGYIRMGLQPGSQRPTALLDLNGEPAINGTEMLHTLGNNVVVTTINNAFQDVQIGAIIVANNSSRIVVGLTTPNEIIVNAAVNWQNNATGYPFSFRNPLLKLKDNGTDRAIFQADGTFQVNGRVSGTLPVFNVLDFGAVPLQPVVSGSNSHEGGIIDPEARSLTDNNRFANVFIRSLVNITNGSNASGTISTIEFADPNVIVISPDHGLITNERIKITGTSHYDGNWQITRQDVNSFILNGANNNENEAKGTWIRSNCGLFEIWDSADNNQIVGVWPTFSAYQSNVRWQVNACGTNGQIENNILTDRNTASVIEGDTLWIHSGPNTGVYPNILVFHNDDRILLRNGDFPQNQDVFVSWKATRGPLVDNTSAFQAAIDAAATAGGGIVYVPAGYYYFNNTETIVLRSNVILKGMWTSPPLWRNDLWQAGVTQGPVLLPTGNQGRPNNRPFISLQGNSGSCIIEGLSIYYPLQHLSGSELSLSVQEYPYCIDVQASNNWTGCENRVINIQLVNPYQGIRIEAAPGAVPNDVAGTGRNHVCNVYGTPLNVGIFINHLSDVSYIEKINFNPDMLASNDYTLDNGGQPGLKDWRTYYVQNLTAIIIKNVNWIVLKDIFALLPHCGILILEDTLSGEAEFMGSDIQFDQADIGLHVNLPNSSSFLDVEFVNVRITTYQIGSDVVNSPAAYQTRKCIYGDPGSASNSNGILTINNGSLANFYSLDSNENRVIDWQIPSENFNLMVTNIWFNSSAIGLATGLYANNGRILLHGCLFSGSFAQCFEIRSGAKSGIVYGNDYADNTNIGINAAQRTDFSIFGRTGIGTSSPIQLIDIRGNWNSSGGDGIAVRNLNNTDASSPAQIFFDRSAIANEQHAAVGIDDTTRNFFIWANGSDRLNIDRNGKILIDNELEQKNDVHNGLICNVTQNTPAPGGFAEGYGSKRIRFVRIVPPSLPPAHGINFPGTLYWLIIENA